jgi:probable rRNA maturation factor
MASVLVTDEQDRRPVDTQRWVSLAGSVLDVEGVGDGGELSMAFVDEATMADLNRRFAGEEGPTDVLAFPMDDRDPGSGMPTMLGDVVICPTVAERNAAGHAGAYEDELALLVVHGILHLMGMDHEDPLEAPLMQRRERELLDRFHAAPVRARP